MTGIRKILTCVLSLCIILGILPTVGSSAETALSPLPDTEGVTRIAVMGDSHVGSEEGSDRFALTLTTLSALAPDYDGLAMNGDIIMQWGSPDDNFAVSADAYDIVKADLETIASGKSISWAMGNHEFPQYCYLKYAKNDAELAQIESSIALSKQYYTEKTGMELYDDVLIGGYHVISAAPVDYSNLLGADGESYIMNKIDSLIETEGNEKPIFINIHRSPQNTVLGGEEPYEDSYTDEFIAYLKTRPNVIMLTGHDHESLYDPRTIWQDGFTVMEAGYTTGSGGVAVSGEPIYPRYRSQDCLLLEIDSDNVVTVKKIDVKNQCYIGEDWVLDIPNMVKDTSDTAYWKYTDARYNASPVPYFEENAAITASNVTATSATLSFPQAKIESFLGDDVIRCYNVKIINKKLNTIVQDYDISSDFYEAPSVRVNPFVFNVKELNEGTEYNIKIAAVSPYGKVSEPLTGYFKTTAAAISDEENESESTFMSPDDDTRNPDVKYVASLTDDENAPEWGSTGLRYLTEYEETNSETFGRNIIRDTRGANDGFFYTFYEKGQYITYEFSVETDGVYEIMAITDTAENEQTVEFYVDGIMFERFTAPNNGVWHTRNEGVKTSTDYTAVGMLPLKAGTHTVKMQVPKSASLNGELHFWGLALAKEVDAKIINQSYEDSTTLVHPNNCTIYKEVSVPHAMIHGSVTASFSVEAEKNGTYDVYGVLGTSNADGHTFSVAVDGLTAFSDSIATNNSLGFVKLSGQVALSAGEHTFSIITGAEQPAYMMLSQIFLVCKGGEAEWTWERFNLGSDYADSLKEVNMSNGASYADSFGMGRGCYFTFSVTPQKTGIYSLSYYAAGIDAGIQTFVNSELFAETVISTSSGAVTDAVWSEKIKLALIKGMTYDIKVLRYDGGDAMFKIVDVVFEEDLTSGKGVFYDLFAGEYTETNVEESSENSAWPRWGDGRGDGGYSLYGSRYVSYDITVDFPGWYEASVLAYSPFSSSNPASLSLYVDGMLKNSIDAVQQGTTKLSNDMGEIFLTKGNHTIKLLNDSGDMDYFKTRISYAREDDGTAEVSFLYDCLSYTAKGGSNVQEHFSPYNGMVLAEGNSYAEYTVDVPGGNYALEICYGAENWDAQMSITLNGGVLGVYSLPQNNSFIHKETYNREKFYIPEILSLEEGINTIKLRCENSKYFSFTEFKLTRVLTPEIQLYNSEYIVPGTQITAVANGINTVRAYLPSFFENKAVEMLVCIYENGRLYKTEIAETQKASVNDVFVAIIKDVSLNSKNTYTMKAFFWNGREDMIPLCEAVPIA